MVGGFKYDGLMKIAFLNDKIEENLGEYKKNFDIIVLNDGNFYFVNEIMREILEKHKI